MNRNTHALISALGTLKDHIRNEVSDEARKASPSMERIAELTDRYRVASALNSGLISGRDPAYDVLAAKAMAQVDAVRPLVNRGDGHDLTAFEMMTYLVDAAVADFAPCTVKKGVNYLAIDSSMRRSAPSAWEHLAEAMDRHPGAVLNPYLRSPNPTVSQMDAEDLEIMGVDADKVAEACDPEKLCADWTRAIVERVEDDGDLRMAALVQTLDGLGVEYADVALGDAGEPVRESAPDRPEAPETARTENEEER